MGQRVAAPVPDQSNRIELMIELWRPIPGYEGFYEAGDLGNIRSVDRQVKYSDGCVRLHKGRVLKQAAGSKGYLLVTLCKEGKQTSHNVHGLILTAFRGPRPEGCEVCHNDGNQLNNRLSNLRWDTRSANGRDRALHGTNCPGEENGNSKLTEDEVRAIRADSRSGIAVAKTYSVSATLISNIRRRKTWAHVA